MTTIITDPADLLDRAAEEIMRRGLMQGMFRDRTGTAASCRVCALGALSVALTTDPHPDSYGAFDMVPFENAIWHLAATVGWGPGADDDTSAIAAWNDTPGRTAEEVAAGMRAAARHARGGAS